MKRGWIDRKLVSYLPGVFVLMTLVCCAAAGASDPGHSQPAPLWTLALQSFGYQDSPPGHGWLGPRPDTGILFKDSRTVLVYFVVEGTEPSLASRDPHHTSTSFYLQSVFVDAENGKLLTTRNWPTRQYPSEIFTTAKGNLVVRTGDLLTLYSVGLEPVRERVLPAIGTYSGVWHAKISPSGTSFWLYQTIGSQIELVDSDSFEVLMSRSDGSVRPEASFSDRAIIQVQDVGGPVEIKTLNSGWKALYPSGESGCGGLYSFVTDTKIIIGNCNSIKLISADGRVLAEDPIVGRRLVENKAAASMNGLVAAISLAKHKGGFFDTTVRRSTTTIVAYDLLKMRRLGTLNVEPVPRHNYDFALSPDGRLLAVMSDGVIKVYKIADVTQD